MNYEELQKLFMENQDKSQIGLARSLGRDPAVMNRMVKGSVKIKSDDIPAILNYFNKGVHIDGVGGSVFTIDEIDFNADNDKAIAQWQIPTSFFENDIKAEAIKIIRVKGDSMSPEIDSGDRLVIDTKDKAPSPSGLFLLKDGSGYLIRRCEVIINSKPVEIKISTINQAYDAAQIALGDIEIIGRVITHVRKF